MKNFFIYFLILFFLLFSLAPSIYEWNSQERIKPERYFELVHNFPTDYNLYLSKIRQGKEGAWVAREKYTSEPHAGSLSQILYISIGRVMAFTHIWIAYHLMRVIFAGLFLFLLWKVVVGVSRDFREQVLAWLLIVTASTWPKFQMVDGLPRFGGYMPWWSVIDSLQRITFLPHVLLGQVLLVFILWRAGRSTGNWIFLGIIGFILGIIFPPALLFIYGVLGVLFLFDKKISQKIVFFLVSIPSLVYYSVLFNEYPWKRLVEFDVLHPTRFSFVEYFLAVGPVLPLGILGVVLGFREKKLRIFLSWVIAWLVFLFVFSKIPQQSPTRFTEMVPHVPLGILGAYFISRLGRLRYLVVTLVIVFGLGSMFSSLLWQKDFVDHKLRADYPLVPKGAEVMYPLKTLIDAMQWFEINTSRSEIVLSGDNTGNLIPVYSGNTVYVGHANTVHLEKKRVFVEAFYKGNSDVEWLKKENIAYVLFGPEEMEWTLYKVKDLRPFYPSLSLLYTNGRVQVYKVP